jgi:hypothetical protein
MQMSPKAMVAIIAFFVAMSSVVLGNMFFIMMIGEINRKRQEGNLISYFGYTPMKVRRVRSEYRSLYPNGKLRIYYVVTEALFVISMTTVALCILLAVDWNAPSE